MYIPPTPLSAYSTVVVAIVLSRPPFCCFVLLDLYWHVGGHCYYESSKGPCQENHVKLETNLT